jgi:hypothetical protein
LAQQLPVPAVPQTSERQAAFEEQGSPGLNPSGPPVVPPPVVVLPPPAAPLDVVPPVETTLVQPAATRTSPTHAIRAFRMSPLPGPVR